MAGKVPARREAKKKPKDAAAKPKIQSLLDEPPQSVEVIKPKRKPRWEKETDEE
ncbi:MAG: hypothetical protein ACR2JZ_04365 [Candidatus Limnocylindrales bacterium]